MTDQEISHALSRSRQVPAYSGYFVTDDGTVISLRRKNPIELKQAENRKYVVVGLMNDAGKQVVHYVHEWCYSPTAVHGPHRRINAGT